MNPKLMATFRSGKPRLILVKTSGLDVVTCWWNLHLFLVLNEESSHEQAQPSLSTKRELYDLTAAMMAMLSQNPEIWTHSDCAKQTRAYTHRGRSKCSNGSISSFKWPLISLCNSENVANYYNGRKIRQRWFIVEDVFSQGVLCVMLFVPPLPRKRNVVTFFRRQNTPSASLIHSIFHASRSVHRTASILLIYLTIIYRFDNMWS